MITRNELETLQAFLATTHAEKLIGHYIGAKFDAEEIWRALERAPRFEKLLENINKQITAMNEIIAIGQALEQSELPLQLQMGMSAAIDYKRNLQKLFIGV